MIKNPEHFQKFEDEMTRKDNMTYMQKLSLLNSMYKYAIKLGTLPPQDPLEGIENDIRLAKILNGIREDSY